MSGLLIKDFRLMCQQKVFFLIIIAVSVFFVSSWDNCMFVVSYCTMFCACFSLTTISYDELNHGLSFLFTLPVSRRQYVAEKYLFGFLLGAGGWLFSALVSGSYIYVTGVTELSKEWFYTAFLTLAAMCVFLCVILPIQLKFGAEKSRIIMILLLLCVFGGVKMLDVVGEAEIFMIFSIGDIRLFADLPLAAALAGAGVLTVLIMVVSVCISVHILEKKEF